MIYLVSNNMFETIYNTIQISNIPILLKNETVNKCKIKNEYIKLDRVTLSTLQTSKPYS